MDPATGKLITKVARAGKKDIDMAVDAAWAAKEAWAKVTPAQRSQLIHKFADELLRHKEELVHIESLDNGKPLWGAEKDVDFAANIFRYNAGACERLGGISFSRDETSQFGIVRKEPIGVAGCITPWNFPLLMTTFKMAPLLASGTTGLFKPPELAPLSSLKMAEIWSNIDGVVPGVVNMVPGVGAEAGEAIVDHPNVSSIHFTGSTAIGKRIKSRAAETMKRVCLELGGKNPLIVFDDADLMKATICAKVYGTINTGQFCAAPTRLFVHEKVHDQFVENLVGMLQSQKYGRFDEPDIWGGPVISENQLNKVLSYIQSGKDEGAKLVSGGNRIDRPGFFVEPTVFTECHDDMKIVREEIFG